LTRYLARYKKSRTPDENAEELPRLDASVDTVNGQCDLIEKSVTLLGQAFGSASYYQKCNILMTDKRKVKDLWHGQF